MITTESDEAQQTNVNGPKDIHTHLRLAALKVCLAQRLAFRGCIHILQTIFQAATVADARSQHEAIDEFVIDILARARVLFLLVTSSAHVESNSCRDRF